MQTKKSKLENQFQLSKLNELEREQGREGKKEEERREGRKEGGKKRGRQRQNRRILKIQGQFLELKDQRLSFVKLCHFPNTVNYEVTTSRHMMKFQNSRDKEKSLEEYRELRTIGRIQRI